MCRIWIHKEENSWQATAAPSCNLWPVSVQTKNGFCFQKDKEKEEEENYKYDLNSLEGGGSVHGQQMGQAVLCLAKKPYGTRNGWGADIHCKGWWKDKDRGEEAEAKAAIVDGLFFFCKWGDGTEGKWILGNLQSWVAGSHT